MLSEINHYSECIMRSGWNVRRISFFLFPFTFSLFFAGCYNYDQELTLNRDGSGTLRVRIEMAQFTVSGETGSMLEKHKRQPCQTPTMEFEEAQGVELLSCEEWIEDYRIYEEATYSFEKVDKLSTKGWSYLWEREGAYRILRVSFDTGEDPPTEAEKAGAAEEMAGFRGARFKVTLPKKIVEAPGAVIDGNMATWDYPWEKVISEGLTRIDMEAKVKLNWFQRIFGW
jgi:hypothetical protein